MDLYFIKIKTDWYDMEFEKRKKNKERKKELIQLN